MDKNHASRRRSEKRLRRALKQRRRSQTGRKKSARAGGSAPQTLSFGCGEAHDNCPCCRAMDELGIADGQPMSQEQYKAYQGRVDELIAAEGLPGGFRISGEELQRRADWIDGRLRERGHYVDLDALGRLGDTDLAEQMRRVDELSREYERLTDRAALHSEEGQSSALPS